LQQEPKFGCGNFSTVGPVEGQADRIGCKRLLCGCYRCMGCLPRKLRRVRTRIAQIATEKKLLKFVTLTLDPKKIPHSISSDRYLRETWRKMRVLLARRFGQSINFIGVLEFQKSGVAHLHLLVGVYIPQDWLSSAWQSVGGGQIVDIRYVDIQRIAGYLTRYLTGDKVLRTISLLPYRARIFTCSRSISLFGPKQESDWWLTKRDIDALHRHSPKTENERYEFLQGSVRGKGETLMYFESLFPENPDGRASP
jgi:hypothetical protein